MNEPETPRKRIAIVGGGPSALYLYKNLVQNANSNYSVDIFERKSQLGSGMPYSKDGANVEHVTNVSCNEIPPLVTPMQEWLEKQSAEQFETFHISAQTFNENKVLPRLLFGAYLANQFELLRQQAAIIGLTTAVHYNTVVEDVIDNVSGNPVVVRDTAGHDMKFDYVVICTGHRWPTRKEDEERGYFDSPYPPSKLQRTHNHSVGLRGSSLTAVDAIRTLARQHGTYTRDQNDRLQFATNEDASEFRLVMHSRNGLLPCVRFHTETPELGTGSLITEADVAANMAINDGFLSLDFVFDKNFKQPLREKDPELFDRIKGMSLEEFVAMMLGVREGIDPFDFFKGEYAEAQKSIRRKQSIHWKEMLSNLSFAMNYPAKHMSAEDMRRHQKVLMPLISIVIAFVPQSSCEELIALHDAGKLELVAVGDDGRVEPNADHGATLYYRDENENSMQQSFQTFVDCTGQPHLSIQEFPFSSLRNEGRLIPAQLQFRSDAEGERLLHQGDSKVAHRNNGKYFLNVPGVAITDQFQIIDTEGLENPRIFMMAVPYIGGFNPDYSGLDFCDEAGSTIVNKILGITELVE